MRSIIRSNGHLHEETTSIKIVERDPNFDYLYWCESKDLSKNTPSNFTYLIKYLGGDKDERENFTVNFASLGPCKINWIFAPKENKILSGNSEEKSMSLNFSRGTIKEVVVNAMYTQTGPKYSPPAISIENSTSKFEADISVHDWDNFFREHYEILSTAILVLTFIMSIIGLIYFEKKYLEYAKKRINLQRRIIQKLWRN